MESWVKYFTPLEVLTSEIRAQRISSDDSATIKAYLRIAFKFCATISLVILCSRAASLKCNSGGKLGFLSNTVYTLQRILFTQRAHVMPFLVNNSLHLSP